MVGRREMRNTVTGSPCAARCSRSWTPGPDLDQRLMAADVAPQGWSSARLHKIRRAWGKGNGTTRANGRKGRGAPGKFEGTAEAGHHFAGDRKVNDHVGRRRRRHGEEERQTEFTDAGESEAVTPEEDQVLVQSNGAWPAPPAATPCDIDRRSCSMSTARTALSRQPLRRPDEDKQVPRMMPGLRAPSLSVKARCPTGIEADARRGIATRYLPFTADGNCAPSSPARATP